MKKVFEEVIKNHNIILSCVVQVSSEPNGMFSYKKIQRCTGRRPYKHRDRDWSYVATESTGIIDMMKSLESNYGF